MKVGFKLMILCCMTVSTILLLSGAAPAANIMVNGSFETGNLSGWQPVNFSGPAGQLTSETAADGMYSYKITHLSNSDWTCIGQNILGKIQPDKDYIFSFAYKTTDPNGTGFNTRFAFGDARLYMHSHYAIGLDVNTTETYYGWGPPITDRYPWYPTEYTFAIAPLIADGEWHYVSAKIATTEAFLYHEPGLGFYYDYGTVGTIYVDDFQVYEAPAIEAFLDIDPDTLNMKSKGNFITAYIQLPDGNAEDIDPASVLVAGSIAPEASPLEVGDYNFDGVADLMVKIDRYLLQKVLTAGDAVAVTVYGTLYDGSEFNGVDTIRVIDKGMDHIDQEDPSSVQY